MSLSVKSKVKVQRLEAVITSADGKIRNLGRIDNKWWAPRLWYYRYIVYPRLKRNQNGAI